VIAAIYVQTGGVYFGLDGVDPWDEPRNAMLYDGPHPVVAHPPCARWCALAKFVEHVYGHKVGDDGGTFAHALECVRRFGGVLEHPAHSLAWSRYDLPTPCDHAWQRGTCGGWVTEIRQVAYGHAARKATWLYVFGAESLPRLDWHSRRPVTAQVGSYTRARAGMPARRGKNRMPKRAASATPEAFRDLLLSIARSVTR
jgi:hypothetical protein